VLDIDRNVMHGWPDVRPNAFEHSRPFRIVFDDVDALHAGLTGIGLVTIPASPDDAILVHRLHSVVVWKHA